MAESAVSLLVEKLAMFLEKEVRLLKGVREKIEPIREELESIRAFLKSAESSRENRRDVKVWVRQVREVAHDMEDILDEFMLNLARDHGHGFMWYFHKIKSFVQNLKARHHVSSRIDEIKSRVERIAERRQRYNFIEPSASAPTSGTSWYDLREDALLVEEGDLVGIDEPREEIIEWLVDGEPGLKVLSISGMGGLGKTTLAKRVYDNQRVKAYFQSHAWINVSQSGKIEDILRHMIVQLHKETEQPVPQEKESADRIELNQIVKGFLQEKRYVIVLDDVWDSNALEGIKFAMPSSSFCSRILITTRTADVATVSFNKSEAYELKHLPPEESWSLLCKKAFQGKPCPPLLEPVSRQILKRCEGLPLAIVTIGGLLFAKNYRDCQIISHSLAAELENNDKSQNFKKILSLSYNDLHYNLKSCFLYLGVFPEDHVIQCMRLIRLWIAEGFVEKREGMTQEEVAERYLKELINRSLVQIAETTLEGRIKSCRVHDLMRESIVSESRDIQFVSFASEQKVELHERVRRLSIQYTCNNALKELNLPSLRSLLIFESATSSTSDEQFVPSGCQLLRVLDLGGSSLHKFPQAISVLFHLKYLSLRGTKVSIIPRSIGKLQNLETLDLKHTLVSELPMEITKLKKLQYLLVYDHARFTDSMPFQFIRGFTAPRGIGTLALLQKLCYVKAGGGQSKNTMRELGELSQLRRLGVTDLKTDDAKEVCHSIEKMTHLRSLDLSAESEFGVIDLEFLSSPPPLLQGLYIKGRLKKLPRWLPQLNNLAQVRLMCSKLRISPLNALQNLPNLVELQLANAFDGEILDFEDRGFKKLKMLHLIDMENLRFLRFVSGHAMPCLQSLHIENCRHLNWQSLLVVIHSFTLLKALNFDDMPEEFALAFYPYHDSRIMRQGILQKCYEEVMERNPEIYFHWWEVDRRARYNLSQYCYNVIKGRVMSRH
ncbi:hypothetical protein BT93_H2264 [Corymbia citriodora subsp. variegata]|nr:hypothetical protein BT93_H2264 [Corymbia citriodora subsp. variegata]